MKEKYILANWKQNGSTDLLAKMAEALHSFTYSSNIRVGIFPPAIYLGLTEKIFQKTSILFGIQNISAHPNGAYTGEIAASMCLDVHAQMALIGHSERRHIFADTNEICATKFKNAVHAGVTPVFCIGETLSEHEKGFTKKVLTEQLNSIKDFLTAHFLIAYEPVWAIGTGKAASKEEAQETHAFIRSLLPENYRHTPIVYGGSVNANNTASFLQMPDIDGVLVGGASLDPCTFKKIVAAAT